MTDDIDIRLPEIIEINVRCEADYYGITALIAKNLGKKRRPISNCTWKHGWSGSNSLKYPEQLLLESRVSRVLVHTEEQASLLKNAGYSDVHVVGMPFCYAYNLIEKSIRSKCSLLVMPPHVSRYFSPNFNEIEYVSVIKKLRPEFNDILICISGECERQQKWRASFEREGFKVIVGADVFNANALARMVKLFSAFEVVTSPNLGSHLVYAALCGCRISIFGPCYGITKADFVDEPYYRRFPHVLELIFSEEALKFQNRVKKRFECHPQEAQEHFDWAVKETGYKNIIELNDMASLLGWNFRIQIGRVMLVGLKKFIRIFAKIRSLLLRADFSRNRNTF